MELQLVHSDSEACVFDFCENKEDIKLGMIGGTICPQCQGILRRYGVDYNAIYALEQILDVVRSESIGKPIIIDDNQAFVVMRFTNNDENDHAYKYGIKAALEAMEVKCVRADDTINSAQILQKILKSIERSRFVIAKVDERNLNVYFELGLAMGLSKNDIQS